MSKLNKAQQLELETLRKERDMARALAWPNFPEPKPMTPLEYPNSSVIHGWCINVYSVVVSEEWQDSLCAYTNAKLQNGSGRRDALYATKADAYRALYHALARKYGEIMAQVLANAGDVTSLEK